MPSARKAGRRIFAVAVLAVATSVAGASPALAAGTLAIVDEPSPVNRTLQFTAGAGDTNVLTISQSAVQLTVTDTGATITEAEAACTGSGTSTIVCTAAGITQIGATLLDGNDRIENSSTLGSDFFGGEGNDTLIGSEVADWTIDGGSGQDTIDGRGGNDRRTFGLLGGLGSDNVTGGDGNDLLNGADVIDTPGDVADTLDGGAGVDDLRGGDGADTLLGGPDVDTVDGGEGADVVRGEGGDDRMHESRDGVADELFGDSGDDGFMITRFPFPPEQGDDKMDGGPGADKVDVQDFTWLFSGGTTTAPATVRSPGRKVYVTHTCDEPVSLRVTLSAALTARVVAARIGDVTLVSKSLARRAVKRRLQRADPARLPRGARSPSGAAAQRDGHRPRGQPQHAGQGDQAAAAVAKSA